MIISANRMSTMNGNYVIAANESYTVDDMGQILIENERNDMAIFNAMLRTDMHQIQARTEGTLLESEIRAMNEASVRDLFNTIAEKIKKAWAKIKGWFQSAYSMVTAYCVRNGKAFVAANRKALATLKPDTKVPGKNFALTSGAKRNFESGIAFGAAKDIADLVKFDASASSNPSGSDMTKTVLVHYIGKDFENSDKKPYAFLKDKFFVEKTDATLGEYGSVSELQADLENGMSAVKTLKKTERDLEKEVKNILKDLQKKAKSDSKDLKDEEKTKKEREADFYRVASSAVTNGMSIYTKAMVKLVKFRLAQERIVLAKAIGKQARTESTLMESMILEAAEELETLGADSVDPADVDLEEIKNAVVDAVEEVLDQEAGEDASDEGDDE